MTKLDAARVAELKRAWLGGASVSELADRFGLCRNHVYKIVRGGVWADVTPAPPVASSVEYRSIEGFPDYQIGSDRRVWSHRTGRWKPLRLARGRKGSPAVVLCKPGDPRPYVRWIDRLHRETFLVPPKLPEGPRHSRDAEEDNHEEEPLAPPAVVTRAASIPPRHRPIRPPSPPFPVPRPARRPVRPPLPSPAAVVAPGGPLGLGPMARGDDHPHAALDSSQVIELRTLRAAGWKLEALASRFGLSEQAVSRIASGKAYRHVGPSPAPPDE